MIKYIKYFIPLVLLFISCSSPDFRTLESASQTGVTMEARYWKGFFGGGGAFELRMTNNSGTDYHNCILVLDGKYKHTIEGLHSKEKGLIKDSVFAKGEQLTFQFGGEVNNLIFFEGVEEGYIPNTVGITCLEGDFVWKME